MPAKKKTTEAKYQKTTKKAIVAEWQGSSPEYPIPNRQVKGRIGYLIQSLLAGDVRDAQGTSIAYVKLLNRRVAILKPAKDMNAAEFAEIEDMLEMTTESELQHRWSIVPSVLAGGGAFGVWVDERNQVILYPVPGKRYKSDVWINNLIRRRIAKLGGGPDNHPAP